MATARSLASTAVAATAVVAGLTASLASTASTASPASTAPPRPEATSTATASAPAPDAAAAPVLVIENVSVVTMGKAGVLHRQTVVVRDGRIASVVPTHLATTPRDAELRLDGQGRFLIPGLAEMHAHVPPGSPPPQLLEDLLFLYVANGVTTIRGMLGAPYQLDLRERIERGEVLGPRLLVGAPSLNGNSAPDPETAVRRVGEYAAAGYDFLKLHPGLSATTYDAIVEAAGRHGITTGGHVSIDVGLERTLEAGQGTIDHMDGFLEASLPDALRARVRSPDMVVPIQEAWRAARVDRLPALARATREAGVWVVPTAYLWESIYGPLDPQEGAAWPEMRYAPRSMVDGWIRQKQGMLQQLERERVSAADLETYLAFRRALLRVLGEEGVGILLGTDSPQLFSVPGFSLHREIEYMARHGFTPEQILEAGTVNVARYARDVLGLPGDFGTVEPGQRADLVLLDGNPLEDPGLLRSPAGVLLSGRWIPAAEIRQRLDDIASRNPAR